MAQNTFKDSTLNGATGAPAPNMAPASNFDVTVTFAPQVSIVKLGDGSTTATPARPQKAGDPDIMIEVEFDFSVEVTGVPRLQLNSLNGGAATYATYDSYVAASDQKKLLFKYQIAAGHGTSGQKLHAAALELNGGTILLKGSETPYTTPVVLTVPAYGTGNALSGARNILIDTTAPTVVSNPPATLQWGTGTFSVKFKMSKALEPTSVTTADLTVQDGTCTVNKPTVAGFALNGPTNDEITFNLSANTCTAGQTYKLVFNPNSVTDVATNAGTGAALETVVTTYTIAPSISVAAPTVVSPAWTLAPEPLRVNKDRKISYTATYTNFSEISLVAGNVTVGMAGTVAACEASLVTPGTPLDVTRQVEISKCTGDGLVSPSIAAATAVNTWGMTAPAVASGASPLVDTFTVDNTALPTPTSSLAPSNLINITNPPINAPDFTLTFAGDVLAPLADLQTVGALKFQCNGADIAGHAIVRTSNTVVTVTPPPNATFASVNGNEPYGANCNIVGTDLLDAAGNKKSFSLPFRLTRTPVLSSVNGGGTISTTTHSAANLSLGFLMFVDPMKESTLQAVAATALQCTLAPAPAAAVPLTITAYAPNVYHFAVTGPAPAAFADTATCVLTLPVTVTNTLETPLATPITRSFTLIP